MECAENYLKKIKSDNLKINHSSKLRINKNINELIGLYNENEKKIIDQVNISNDIFLSDCEDNKDIFESIYNSPDFLK